MSSMPTAGVSVVIPSYNGADRLPACLAALAEQTFAGEVEVIVVTDGSTDDTDAAAMRGGARVVHNRGRRGPAGARNTGIEEARFPIIAFTDDDARPDADWLECLVDALAADDVLAAGGTTIPSDDVHLLCRYLTANNPLLPLEIELASSRGHARRLLDYLRASAGVQGRRSGRRPVYATGTVNLAVRTEALRAIGGFDDSFPFSGEDQDLCRRINHAQPRSVVHEPSAVVLHEFDPRLMDSLRRARAYARGNATLRRKHREIGAVIFPVPLIWATATAALLAARRPRLALLPTLAIPLAYSRYLAMAWRQRYPEALIYGYLQFLHETAGNLGFVEGEIDAAFPGERDSS